MATGSPSPKQGPVIRTGLGVVDRSIPGGPLAWPHSACAGARCVSRLRARPCATSQAGGGSSCYRLATVRWITPSQTGSSPFSTRARRRWIAGAGLACCALPSPAAVAVSDSQAMRDPAAAGPRGARRLRLRCGCPDNGSIEEAVGQGVCLSPGVFHPAIAWRQSDGSPPPGPGGACVPSSSAVAFRRKPADVGSGGRAGRYS